MAPTPDQTQPVQPAGPSVPLSQATHLLTSFTYFLTVCIHNILYYRSLYPAATFLTSRAYNLPVHQSRHPKVCAWIRDAVDAVRAQIVQGAVERVAVVIYDDRARVMERWMFDVGGFPAWRGFLLGKGKWKERDRDEDGGERGVDGAESGFDAAAANANAAEGKVNWTDVDEQLRAAIRRLAYAGEKMGPLPAGCTFTVAVELRDQAEAPIGHPQPWVPTQPNLQTKSSERETAGEDVGGAKTTPLRAVEAGPLFFECWVEEGKAKEEPSSTLSSNN
ncbi:Uu.00g049070.m01.CDS01 [Anthostomella pinea]|uniref:Uu.00g049070.m01.CDS01 n=1 Tax=Anthostomella pinea TaxID=933095 RepID=A0AAI8VBV0_9PEZI|nr:Uu.00g049070.m01.CDS01 [Anthostomella pinea]